MSFFNDLLLPQEISFNFVSDPYYDIGRVELPNGKVYRTIRNSNPIYRYSCSYDSLQFENSEAAVQAAFNDIVAVFHRTQAAHSFRFRDWSDYILDNEIIGYTDGSTTYQLTKTYGATSPSLVRNITKPVTSTEVFGKTSGRAIRTPVTITVGSQSPQPSYTIDSETGIVTFTDSPVPSSTSPRTPIYASGHFDVPVMFDQDNFPTTYRTFKVGGVSINLLEDRTA